MEKNKKANACCTSHRCEILGAVLLAIATILTVLTYSGLGIFGMFLVGLVFCCHKHWSCPTESCCDVHEPEVKKEVTVKKVSPKK